MRNQARRRRVGPAGRSQPSTDPSRANGTTTIAPPTGTSPLWPLPSLHGRGCGSAPLLCPGGGPPSVGQGGRSSPPDTGTGVGCGVGAGVGAGVAAGVGAGVAAGVGVATGIGVGVAAGVGVAGGVGVGVGWGVGVGVGRGLGFPAGGGVGDACGPGRLAGVGSLAGSPLAAGVGVGATATIGFDGSAAGTGLEVGVGVGVATSAIGGTAVGAGDALGRVPGAGDGEGTVATFWEGRTVGPVCTMVPKPRANPASTRLTIPSARTRRARWATVTAIGALLSAGCGWRAREPNGSTRPPPGNGWSHFATQPSRNTSIGSYRAGPPPVRLSYSPIRSIGQAIRRPAEASIRRAATLAPAGTPSARARVR